MPGKEDVLARSWALDPQVALRAEPFGALAYHYGTRRLTLMKSVKLVEVVKGLESHSDAHGACTAAGVPDKELSIYATAIDSLARGGMLVERRVP